MMATAVEPTSRWLATLTVRAVGHPRWTQVLLGRLLTNSRTLSGLYGHLVEKLKSSEWAMSQELRKQKERELQQCEKLLETRPKDKDLLRHTIVLRRQCEIDKSENRRLEKGTTPCRPMPPSAIALTQPTPLALLLCLWPDREELLHSAVENYLRCLLSGDKYDIRVMFRLCSLWFNNPSGS